MENARAIQRHLSAWVVAEGKCEIPNLIGRIEIASTKESNQSATIQAQICIHSNPSRTLLERKVAVKTTAFPSQPGLHSFRKVPAVIAALGKLNRVPNLFICDGRGLTGPDSFGVASHVGLITNIPTIGVRPIKPKHLPEKLGLKRGSWVPLESGNGAILRVLNGQDPVLISPAHKIGLQSAIEQILNYLPASLDNRTYQQFLYPDTKQLQHKENTSKPEKGHLTLIKSATGQ
ncbi:MAG: endonuclease V [Pseudomonadales bacterium]|nr:endonuclease V [Pseudomonadales bacterium]